VLTLDATFDKAEMVVGLSFFEYWVILVLFFFLEQFFDKSKDHTFLFHVLWKQIIIKVSIST
jgi:hypothetical protein